MRSRSSRWLLSLLLVVMLMGALPGAVLAAPQTPTGPVEAPSPEPPDTPEAPVQVQAAPIWGAPKVVRAWGGLRLRSGPGLGYPVVLVLYNGETVYPGAGPFWADGYSWTYIRVYRYGRFYEGFCATMYLVPKSAPVPPAPVHGLKVTAPAGLRLRYGPGLTAGICCVAPYGTILQGTGNSASADGHEWAEVKYGVHTLWAAKTYLVAV
ncbi:MAG: SH3 domain-containing protein [Chloroflexi bacterium]|nr:SH3 domain-containing protein [Chloroflexota bacterium]